MRFLETPIPGAYVIEAEPIEDERGYFARTFDRQAFAEMGLEVEIAQCGMSYNRLRGTLRGLHFQTRPYDEAKLVRCTSGAIFDVVVDIRPASATFGRWHGVFLDAKDGNALYLPKGCAHGFQVMEKGSQVFYQISNIFASAHSRGIRWDDPDLGIEWPLPVRSISERDAALPYLANVGEFL